MLNSTAEPHSFEMTLLHLNVGQLYQAFQLYKELNATTVILNRVFNGKQK